MRPFYKHLLIVSMLALPLAACKDKCSDLKTAMDDIVNSTVNTMNRMYGDGATAEEIQAEWSAGMQELQETAVLAVFDSDCPASEIDQICVRQDRSESEAREHAVAKGEVSSRRTD